MEKGRFRRGVDKVGSFLTGSLTPERLTSERRKEILKELADKKMLARQGIMASPLLSPDGGGVPQVNSITDLLVVTGHLPFEVASNTLLRQIHGLTKAAEKAQNKLTRVA